MCCLKTSLIWNIFASPTTPKTKTNKNWQIISQRSHDSLPTSFFLICHHHVLMLVAIRHVAALTTLQLVLSLIIKNHAIQCPFRLPSIIRSFQFVIAIAMFVCLPKVCKIWILSVTIGRLSMTIITITHDMEHWEMLRSVGRLTITMNLTESMCPLINNNFHPSNHQFILIVQRMMKASLISSTPFMQKMLHELFASKKYFDVLLEKPHK